MALVYQNDNTTIDYQFDCSGNSTQAFIAPWAGGTTVKNLLYPYEEYLLANSSTQLGIEGSDEFNGCMANFTLPAWGFKAFVPVSHFVAAGPMITKFLPGHEYRLQSTVAADESEDVAIEIHFSAEMDCSSLAAVLTFTSTTESGQIAMLNNSTVSCSTVEMTTTSKPVAHRIGEKSLLTPYIRSKPVASQVSLNSFADSNQNYELQKVDQDFRDSRGEYYNLFEKNLEKLCGNTSISSLCIEEYLMKSERKWYGHYKSAKLGRFTVVERATSSSAVSEAEVEDSVVASETSAYAPDRSQAADLSMAHVLAKNEALDHWGLGEEYKPPTGIKLFMQLKVGDWPVYTFFMALGQIIATSSYQITLISGTVGQTPEKLYIVASIYLATSVCWWVMYRMMKSIYVLSIPFLFYGLAFFLLGMAPYAADAAQRGWMQNAATAMYAVASSSGSIFFALNFGDEGGSTVKSWVFRACFIQGTQQIYVCILWAWGYHLTSTISNSLIPHTVTTNDRTLTAIGIPIAVLFWTIAFIMYYGLPTYYRQQPGLVPSFYVSLLRRKIVLWFFFVVIIQNYLLSTMTGRNWAYLWSSNRAKLWQIVLLVIFFFIIVWSAILYGFARLSRAHSWILPLFAVGLGAPRWAQILWSCSNIGAYVPWAGSALGSAIAGRSLWLWLGVLDAIQDVGFGMILLQTLTRVHIAYVLISAQVLGSVATIVARATAPNKIGPGDVFPDFTRGASPGVRRAWFWVGLLAQLLICVGFFRFFRKEQLNKP